MIRNAILSLALASALATPAAAQSDTTFTYQGSLNDSGNPANGTFDLDFSMWDAVTGGSQLGSTVSILSHPVSDGVFTAELDFGADAFGGSPLWLEITVGGETLTPRQPVTSTPFSITTRGIVVDQDNNVGLGTSAPEHPLHVKAPSGSLFTIFGNNPNASGVGVYGLSSGSNSRGVFGQSSVASGTSYGLYGQSNSSEGNGVFGHAAAPTGVNIGVRGLSPSTDGRGVVGRASAATGVTYGMYGQSDSTDGRGVVGLVTAATGINYGVRGITSSTAGTGVFGYASAITGENFGVHGQSDSADGRGVVGSTTAITGTNYGVFGQSSSDAGRGVYGYTTSLTGSSVGVYGETDSAQGRGVIGSASSSAGPATGVIGQSFSTSGIGVTGSAFASSGLTFGVFGNSNSPTGYDFFAGGTGINYGAGSSIRWKDNITNIDNPLEKLAALRGVYFDWDNDHGGTHDIGMIAEEVGKVLPEIVAFEEDGVYAHGMDYSKLTPLLVEAVNTLSREQGARIHALEQENARLQSRLVAIEAAMQALSSPSEQGDN